MIVAVSNFLKTLVASATPGMIPLILLPDMKVSTFNYIFSYIYNGEVQVPACEYMDFIEAFKLLQLKGQVPEFVPVRTVKQTMVPLHLDLVEDEVELIDVDSEPKQAHAVIKDRIKKASLQEVVSSRQISNKVDMITVDEIAPRRKLEDGEVEDSDEEMELTARDVAKKLSSEFDLDPTPVISKNQVEDESLILKCEALEEVLCGQDVVSSTKISTEMDCTDEFGSDEITDNSDVLFVNLTESSNQERRSTDNSQPVVSSTSRGGRKGTHIKLTKKTKQDASERFFAGIRKVYERFELKPNRIIEAKIKASNMEIKNMVLTGATHNCGLCGKTCRISPFVQKVSGKIYYNTSDLYKHLTNKHKSD